MTGRVDGRPRPVVSISPSFGSFSPASVSVVEAAAGCELVRPGSAWASDAPAILADAVGLIVGTQPIDAQLIAAAPRLTVISKNGAGVDNIDVAAATAAGIAVTSAPGANATAVAELVMGLLIGLARGIVTQDRRVRRGDWAFSAGKALEHSTLGIVGMGRIGRLVAARALAFDMRVVAHDAIAAEAGGAADWEYVGLDALLEQSDFVSLHVPLLPDTRGMIGADALRRMKRTAFLINASRGGVVDEQALNDALAAEEIAGAALDVLEAEPMASDHPLAARTDTTILTPHMAAYTDHALAVTSEITAANIAAALRGTFPPNALERPESWRGALPEHTSVRQEVRD